MSLTLVDIDNAENAIKTVRVKLQGIGREIHKMREGRELGPEYGFERYLRINFDGPQYLHEEGPDWGVGTLIFSLIYYWPRGENTVCVTFPQGWLEQDWRALEQSRLNKERAETAEHERLAGEKKAREIADAERQTYEFLKTKFEGQP